MSWLFGVESWRDVSGWIERALGVEPATSNKLLLSLLFIAVFVLLSRLLRRQLLSQIRETSLRYRASKLIKTFLGVLLFIALTKIWLAHLDLATYFGILSAGLAIAFKDPLVNMAGWVFIRVRRPFAVGDRIQLGGHSGDIVDIRLFSFVMLEVGNWVHADQSTGRILHLPNGHIFSQPCANYTEGFAYIWNELPVTVTFESDHERAHQLLSQVVNEHAPDTDEVAKQVHLLSDRYQVSYRYLTPIVYLEVVNIGVRLTLRYLCPVRQRRATIDRLWREILRVFAKEPSIDFAYPTTRFYDNRREGKPGAGGPAEAPNDEAPQAAREEGSEGGSSRR
ncbi:MAG: mechanosensitive ion channel protein MscS [Proteobacteria bacterium]|nr:MAG: mechanosensitive ion channel protein MscS [Pseudomonadota bacterium]